MAGYMLIWEILNPAYSLRRLRNKDEHWLPTTRCVKKVEHIYFYNKFATVDRFPYFFHS